MLMIIPDIEQFLQFRFDNSRKIREGCLVSTKGLVLVKTMGKENTPIMTLRKDLERNS
jgi:hypothetical protein